MNIHEYLRKYGFEMTEEYRRVSKGDYFLNLAGTPEEWKSIHQSAASYLVLRKLPKTFKFDGQTFREPAGYVFERVGIPSEKDVGKYITSAGTSTYHREFTEDLCGRLDSPYFIFRKENE